MLTRKERAQAEAEILKHDREIQLRKQETFHSGEKNAAAPERCSQRHTSDVNAVDGVEL